MSQFLRLFKSEQPSSRRLSWGDGIVLLTLVVVLYVGVRLGLGAADVIQGPAITLTVRALPWYAALSVVRMAAAYVLSLLFTLVYGYMAASDRRAERVLLPLLDVLQSVPILSFLPVVLLSLSAVLPQRVAVELASIVLIFTSQVWNLTFAWYQSLTTIPSELREASTIFHLNLWLRFKTLELPFAAISLIWNSMMGWAGGWFFLMAAEMFTVGNRDLRLPGLGTYLQEAASQGNLQALALGIATLVLIIVALDQLVWRPLLVWADRFKLEMLEAESPPTSWFYDALLDSRLANWFKRSLVHPLVERFDGYLVQHFPMSTDLSRTQSRAPWVYRLLAIGLGLGLIYGAAKTGRMLLTVPLAQWMNIAVGVGATLLRVFASLLIALAWTVPLGVAIGTNRRLAAWLQPLVQIAASIPATALFPVFLMVLIGLPGGLNVAAVLLMLMGTQWYLLFNVIAGAAAIPQDLKYTSLLLQLSPWDRWRRLILPALFPFLITGGVAASGGAWNASIVAEYVSFSGKTVTTVGVGSLISQATAHGDYPLLLAATLSMICVVVAINRLFWRRLYRLAEKRYRME
jgi:NitT/TauT family transport system permease protein